MTVKVGLEILRENGYAELRDARVGLMTNPSAVDRDLHSAYQILTNASGVKMTALFGPEHGFASVAAEGEEINSQTDARTGLPIYSLYGADVRPSADMLKNVDILVCDIQDIGVRYYTYLWTITHILEAAGENGVAVIILDRPNPLGGLMIDGPILEPEMASFVGRFPIPIQHGMTLGEMAQMMNVLWNPTPADLMVIPCEGWTRDMTWEDTGLVWIPSSPNIPHLSTVYQYPGACLIEGTTLSEGRGTALPFEIVGAPALNGFELAEHMNRLYWLGVRFRPHSFRPTAGKWQGLDCGGVQVHITDRDWWRPVETWMGLIMTIREMYPARSIWPLPRSAKLEPGAIYHFDRLIGSETMRMGIEAGLPLDKLTRTWGQECDDFRAQREPFLIYS